MASQYNPDFNQRRFPRMDIGQTRGARQFSRSPRNVSGRDVAEYATWNVTEYASASEYGTAALLKDDLLKQQLSREMLERQSRPKRRSNRRQSKRRVESPVKGRPSLRGVAELLKSTVQAAAVSVGAVASVMVIYTAMMNVNIVSDAPLANALSFATPVNNPDGVTLLAILTAPDGETITREFVNEPYLRFDGLEKSTEYTLRIVNAETQTEMYRKSYITAEEDPYQIEFQQPTIENGVLSFDLLAGGLERTDFYTITVVAPDGKTVYVMDSADPTQSVSVPLGGDGDGDEKYYIRVKVNGVVSQYEVGGEEPLQEEAEAVPEQPQPVETPPETVPEEPQPAETPPETVSEEPQPVETPPETVPEQPQPVETPPETVPERPQPAETPPETVPEQPQPPETPPEEPQPLETTPETWWYDYDAIVWTWSADDNSAEAFIPRNIGGGVTITAAVDTAETAPTCTEPGAVIRKAIVTGPDGNQYSDTKTAEIPAMGHNFVEVGGESATEAHYQCARCGAEIDVHISIEEETLP